MTGKVGNPGTPRGPYKKKERKSMTAMDNIEFLQEIKKAALRRKTCQSHAVAQEFCNKIDSLITNILEGKVLNEDIETTN